MVPCQACSDDIHAGRISLYLHNWGWDKREKAAGAQPPMDPPVRSGVTTVPQAVALALRYGVHLNIIHPTPVIPPSSPPITINPPRVLARQPSQELQNIQRSEELLYIRQQNQAAAAVRHPRRRRQHRPPAQSQPLTAWQLKMQADNRAVEERKAEKIRAKRQLQQEQRAAAKTPRTPHVGVAKLRKKVGTFTTETKLPRERRPRSRTVGALARPLKMLKTSSTQQSSELTKMHNTRSSSSTRSLLKNDPMAIFFGERVTKRRPARSLPAMARSSGDKRRGHTLWTSPPSSPRSMHEHIPTPLIRGKMLQTGKSGVIRFIRQKDKAESQQRGRTRSPRPLASLPGTADKGQTPKRDKRGSSSKEQVSRERPGGLPWDPGEGSSITEEGDKE